MRYTIKYNRSIPDLRISENAEFGSDAKSIFQAVEDAERWARVKNNIGNTGTYTILYVEKEKKNNSK